MGRVWPDRVVEENNLAAQISVLRRVFGTDRHLIRTVAGRGYQFTGEIRDEKTAVTTAARSTNLPSYLPELIGRETSLGTVVDLITAHRFVTLTGAGGVGKTRLALEAARQLRIALSRRRVAGRARSTRRSRACAWRRRGCRRCPSQRGSGHCRSRGGSVAGETRPDRPRQLRACDPGSRLDGARPSSSGARSCGVLATSREPLRVIEGAHLSCAGVGRPC